MQLRHGFLTAVLVAFVWFGYAFATRPDVAAVPADRAAIHAAIAQVDEWRFTRGVFTPAEWGWLENAEQLAIADAHPADWAKGASAQLASKDTLIGHRLRVLLVLTFLGVLAFWFGVVGFSRARRASPQLSGARFARGIVVLAACVVIGFVLPCLPVEGPRGLVFSVPPLLAGVLVMVVSSRSRDRNDRLRR